MKYITVVSKRLVQYLYYNHNTAVRIKGNIHMNTIANIIQHYSRLS